MAFVDVWILRLQSATFFDISSVIQSINCDAINVKKIGVNKINKTK